MSGLRELNTGLQWTMKGTVNDGIRKVLSRQKQRVEAKAAKAKKEEGKVWIL